MYSQQCLLLHAVQGAPTTKGCGLVTMGSNDEAAAAIEALDNQHVWEGMEAPMVSQVYLMLPHNAVLGYVHAQTGWVSLAPEPLYIWVL